MKRKLKYLIPILVVCLISWLGFQVQVKLQEKEAIENQRAQLPEFIFQTLEGEDFSRNDLKPNRPIAIMFIHPECTICQYEAEELFKHRSEHQHVSWVLVSEAAKEQLEWLEMKFGLAKLPNVKVLQANPGAFYSYFGSELVPSTFVYNESGKLQKYFQGEVKFEAIYKHLPPRLTQQ